MRVTLTHNAMATTFEIAIAGAQARYARQAAAEAFAELDRTEARLSRFAEGSDIFRINRLRPGQATFVHHDTLECLRIAEEVRRDTAGAFDVAYASSAPATSPRFELDELSHTVRVLADGVRLDLGGIGKGFALDRLAALLREWDIASALLAASTSTILALDPPPDDEGGACMVALDLARAGPARGTGWVVEFGPDEAPQRLALANRALSVSGTAVKGAHIIDPRTSRPAERRRRAWAVAPTAALADALSTAFMVMSDAEVRALRARCPAVSGGTIPSPPGPPAT